MSTISTYIDAIDLLKIIKLPKNFLHKKLRIIIESIPNEKPKINKTIALGSMAKCSEIIGDIISPTDTEWEVLK